jgi:hypothetical protein
MIYYLKTDTEEQMLEALVDAGLAHKEYDWSDPLNSLSSSSIEGPELSGAFTYSVGSDKGKVHLIGNIVKKTFLGYDEDGEAQYSFESVEGYHANVRSDSAIEDLPTVPTPATPEFSW